MSSRPGTVLDGHFGGRDALTSPSGAARMSHLRQCTKSAFEAILCLDGPWRLRPSSSAPVGWWPCLVPCGPKPRRSRRPRLFRQRRRRRRPHPIGQLLDTYCVTCHNARLRVAGSYARHGGCLEPRLGRRCMGAGRLKNSSRGHAPRGDAEARAGNLPGTGRLAGARDRPHLGGQPGRRGPSTAVHRLNRTEYNNAIRDLFALDLDVKPLLPGDETADGSFDNFADAQVISTTHLERYLSVARQVTRLAIGLPPAAPRVDTFEIPLHIVQDDRLSDDLPFGSRGGLAVRHIFPVDGEYLIKVRLRRQYQDYIMGMGWPQQLDVRADGRLLKAVHGRRRRPG